jgi:hypothetical protein
MVIDEMYPSDRDHHTFIVFEDEIGTWFLRVFRKD